MAGEHGGCCCNHDDQHDNHDQHDKVGQEPQILTVTEAASCCNGQSEYDETARSNDHAGHLAAGRSSS